MDGIFCIPKIPIWVYFGGPWNGKCLYILLPYGIFYGLLVHFGVIWYIFPRFGLLYQENSGNPSLNMQIGCCGEISETFCASIFASNAIFF
jgi:hypothetical protein